MESTRTEDIIAKQGTNEFRQIVALTNQINDLGMKLAKVERELEQLRPKPDTSEQLVQIRTANQSRWVCETLFLSMPVYMDRPGLGCFDDFANALCRRNADLFDWMSMSLSSWPEAHETFSELTLKRPINYIDGVFGAESLDCNLIRKSVEKAWKGALLPKTAVAELVCNTTNVTAYHGEIAGFLQKTSYGTVWADLIAEAEDSGYLHPDGYDGHCFTEIGHQMAMLATTITQWHGLHNSLQQMPMASFSSTARSQERCCNACQILVEHISKMQALQLQTVAACLRTYMYLCV